MFRYHIIWKITRKIALKSGIEKDVTPYKVIKPSAIIIRLNDQVNAEWVQRMASHKDILTTMKYNHLNENDVVQYLRNQHHDIDYERLPLQQKAELLLGEFFKGNITREMFDRGLKTLKPETMEDKYDFSYS